MRVRMKFQISGTRNGVAWPTPGNTVDLPNDEAVALLRNGMAVAVEDHQVPEKAVAPKAETREEKPKPAPRKPGRPRKAG